MVRGTRQYNRRGHDIFITLKSMVEKKAKVLLMSWHSWTNQFLKGADVFEEGKHFWTIDEMTISYKDDAGKITFPRVNTVLERMMTEMTNTGFEFFFAYVESIQDWDTIKLNSGRVQALINPAYKLRCITDWNKFFFLDDYLKAKGILFTEDEYRFITSIWLWNESIIEPNVGALVTGLSLESERNAQSVTEESSSDLPRKRKSRSKKF